MSTYTGPRKLTRAEKRRFGTMNSAELKAVWLKLFQDGSPMYITNQVRSIMHQVAAYERTVPRNNGKALIDK